MSTGAKEPWVSLSLLTKPRLPNLCLVMGWSGRSEQRHTLQSCKSTGSGGYYSLYISTGGGRTLLEEDHVLFRASRTADMLSGAQPRTVLAPEVQQILAAWEQDAEQ